MKLQEYLLVLFCTIAVTIAASVVSRQEGSIAESAQLSSSTSNVVAGSRVTREADDDEDTDDDAEDKEESPSGIFESFNTILAAAMDMIRNIITIKQNIVIPLSTAAVRTVDTLVNSELTQTVIDTKVNLARTALGVGPRLLDTAVTIAQRKAAVFQLAVCRLFCPLTGGSEEGIKQCQANHCPKEENEEREAKSSSERQAKSKSDDADVIEVEEDDDVEVFAKLEDDEGRNKRKAKAKEEFEALEAEIDADEKELKRKLLKWKKIMAELEEEE